MGMVHYWWSWCASSILGCEDFKIPLMPGVGLELCGLKHVFLQ